MTFPIRRPDDVSDIGAPMVFPLRRPTAFPIRRPDDVSVTEAHGVSDTAPR
jgi:hypothetical protein